MSINVGISDAEPSDLLAILNTDPNTGASIGAAEPGFALPFRVAWPIKPLNVARGLAAEDAGLFLDRWQISCYGESVAQAKANRDKLIGLDWPAGWELKDIGPCIPDTDPAPVGWFIPVDMQYTPTG